MLKLIKLSAALSATAIIVSFPQIARSRPESRTSNYPVVGSSQAGNLFCYMRTQRGATLNLQNLCRPDDGSGNGNRAVPVANSPATNTPNQTSSNGNAGRGPVVITVNGPTSVSNTPAGTNPNANNSNPNGANPNANNSNPNGAIPSANNSNPNGAIPNANNSNANGATPSINNSNPNDATPSAKLQP